jgi:hypothetical protein
MEFTGLCLRSRNVDIDNLSTSVSASNINLPSLAKSNPKTQQRPYHHGDLRRAIVTAALQILSETQNLEFSLREFARCAGVSHNASYKHFADKRELLAVLLATGFVVLTKRMGK